MGKIGFNMNKIILILLFPLLVFGSKFGRVMIWDGDEVVNVQDSALKVYIDDTLNVNLTSLDTLKVSIATPETLDVNIASPLETNGAIPVNIQDQTSRAFDVYFSQIVGVTSTLVNTAVIDSFDIVVSTGHGITVGDQLVIYDAVADRLYVGGALSVTVDTVGLDTPLNFAFDSTSSIISRSTKEMDVDGSSTRQVFSVSPPIGIEIDVTRVMFKIITDDYPELDMFGDIVGGIVKGVVMRSVNGETVNYFNLKTNGEMVNLMYDVSFYEAAKHGVNGLGGRLTYGGASKHGVTIRLGQGDALELIIQDDLTDLISFRMIASGHVVED